MEKTNGNQVSLMFSGGVDSTTAALRLAEKYDRVHLLTFRNGYGHYRLNRTRKRVKELKRHAGDRFVHHMESVQPLFEMMLADALEDYRRAGSGFVWCLGCKMAMHTQSVLYNLRHGIREMTDGSSQSTGEMVEQMLLAVYMVREFYEHYGIEYRTPVYTIPREEEIENLRKRRFRMGWRIGDRFLGIQPKCRPGELYYLPFLVLNQPPTHDEEKVSRFLREKRELAHAYIEKRCLDEGIAPGIAQDTGATPGTMEQ
ncbi:MAG: hypothetical protein GXP54_12030 [Deltaproteobacteria bacterium]|nr:hypothetical protein [Deltaproteobacteria bacterium]